MSDDGTVAKPKVKKPRLSREERQDQITKAAFEIFARDGFEGARIGDIADLASISKGTIYLYYDTKEQIFEAVIRRFIQPQVERIEAAASDEDASTEAKLRSVMEIAYEAFAGTDVRRVIVMLMGEGARFPQLIDIYYEQVMSRLGKLIAAVVQEGVETGEFRELPSEVLPQLVAGPGVMGAIWKEHFDRFRPLDLQLLYRTHLDVLIAGLKAATKPG